MRNKLTKKEKDLIPIYLEKYREIGLSTENMTMSEAYSIIDELYDFMGKGRPVKIYVDSPFSALLAYVLLSSSVNKNGQLWDQLGDQLWAQLGNQLWDQLGDQLWDQLRDQLGDQLWNQLWDQLGDQLGDQLWAQLGNQLWDQIDDQLRDQLGDQVDDQLRDQLGDQVDGQLRDQLGDQVDGQLRDQLGDQLGDQLRNQLWDQLGDPLGNFWYGSYYSYYVSFYDFISNLDRVKIGNKSKNLSIAKSMLNLGWCLCYENVCIISKKPNKISMQFEKLHCEDGPAIEFEDGYKLYAWRGVRLDAEIIESPESITIDQIQSEKNVEKRRCLIEIMGYEKYLKNTKSKLVDEKFLNGQSIKLWLSDFGYTKAKIVELINHTQENDGTCKHYFHRVSGKINDAHEAVASLWGLTKEQYNPVVET